MNEIKEKKRELINIYQDGKFQIKENNDKRRISNEMDIISKNRSNTVMDLVNKFKGNEDKPVPRNFKIKTPKKTIIQKETETNEKMEINEKKENQTEKIEMKIVQKETEKMETNEKKEENQTEINEKKEENEINYKKKLPETPKKKKIEEEYLLINKNDFEKNNEKKEIINGNSSLLSYLIPKNFLQNSNEKDQTEIKKSEQQNEEEEDESNSFEEYEIFEFITVVELKDDNGQLKPEITYCFPNQKDERQKSMISNIPNFCFPDLELIKPTSKIESKTYSFVLTDINYKKKYGYCRRILKESEKDSLPKCYCIISYM
jgi:hypothetical protein